jgi:benzil reductase ((S)-benzoin forming)
MTASTLVIITGASRGLGHAMAAQYLASDAFVVGLSRALSTELRPTANGGLEQWPVDLSDPLPLVERLGQWLADFERKADSALPTRVRLIHNAAALSDPGDVAGSDPADLARSLRVGLEAPVALTAAFLGATAGWTNADRRVLFISSGLGRRAMAGSAAYCAQKAGLDCSSTTSPARSRSRNRRGRTARAWRRWRQASSTPTCRSSCAAPILRASRRRPRSPASTRAVHWTARPAPRRRSSRCWSGMTTARIQ